MNHADREFLEAIDKRCYAEECSEGSDHYFHDVSISEDELLRIFSIVEEDDSLLLLPTSTTFGFGGPCFIIIQCERSNPYVVESTKTRICNFNLRKHVPKNWSWERMVEHFAPPRLLEFYGVKMYSTNASNYDY